MTYTDEYRKRLISLEEAVGKIHSDDKVVVAMAAAQPPGLLSTLHTIKDKVRRVKVIACLLLKDYEFLHDVGKGDDTPFLLEDWYFGGPEKDLYKKGLATFIPNNLHSAGTEKLKAEHINVFMGTATPPDARGYMSLSLNLVYEREMIEQADLVILEVNENLPRTYGDTAINIRDVDFVVEHNAPLLEFPPIEPSEVERLIGSHVSELIPDGATIQLGIGGIPNAITRFLVDKKDIGVHSEMITEGMADLIEAGVVNNSRKTLWKGKTIGAFIMGTQKLYDFVRDNMAVEVHRGSIVNDPYIVAQNERMVSINTALQVDLAGQVCSESFGPMQYTGTGGQLDMHRGATMSKGGVGIIAMRSTAKNGTISTLQPMLTPGSFVTIPRQDTDCIVTEYGIARLKGLSVRERALALIGIAHPDFREGLREEARNINLI